MHKVKGVVVKAKNVPATVETILVPDPGPGEALVDDLVRSIAFYRRQDSAVQDVRLLLTDPLPLRPQLEARLSLLAEEISPEPFGSLVLQGLAMPEAQP